MLIGKYQNSRDAKNRVIIPAKLRDDLKGTCILTKGLDNCLILFSKSAWDLEQDFCRTLDLTDVNARAYLRHTFSNATDCEMDKQGRLLIPQEYLNMIGAEKDLVTIGAMDRVEIWAKEVYESSENGGLLTSESLEKRQLKFKR